MCATCQTSGADHCWSCWEGYTKIPMDTTVAGKCYERCNDGYFRGSDAYCKPCNSSCKNCEGPAATDCLSCDATLVKVPPMDKVKGFCIVNSCNTN